MRYNYDSKAITPGMAHQLQKNDETLVLINNTPDDVLDNIVVLSLGQVLSTIGWNHSNNFLPDTIDGEELILYTVNFILDAAQKGEPCANEVKKLACFGNIYNYAMAKYQAETLNEYTNPSGKRTEVKYMTDEQIFDCLCEELELAGFELPSKELCVGQNRISTELLLIACGPPVNLWTEKGRQMLLDFYTNHRQFSRHGNVLVTEYFRRKE